MPTHSVICLQCSRTISYKRGEYLIRKHDIKNNPDLSEEEKAIKLAALIKEFIPVAGCCRTRFMSEGDFSNLCI